jgi:uncharacterized protein YjbI with pentapeptide repeats
MALAAYFPKQSSAPYSPQKNRSSPKQTSKGEQSAYPSLGMWSTGKAPMNAQELLAEYARGMRQFSEAQLNGAVIFNAKLSFINFSYADLSNADLRGTDLFGSNLSWANLQHANLASCNLGRTNLRGAKLYFADLRSAKLQGAQLKGAFFDKTTLFPADFKPS